VITYRAIYITWQIQELATMRARGRVWGRVSDECLPCAYCCLPCVALPWGQPAWQGL